LTYKEKFQINLKIKMFNKKTKRYLSILILLISPVICQALEIDTLKTDFLQGNYRRVIFEGQAQLCKINIGNTDELNYILGLSYLKEGKLSLAQDCFRRILAHPTGKFAEQATMGLADAYLKDGYFQEAKEIYNQIIDRNSNSDLKAAVLYRLSQLEFKRDNSQQGNVYFSKLRNDFPQSPELKPNIGLGFIRGFSNKIDESFDQGGRVYCVQVGFFSDSANADNLKNKLLSKNLPAYIENSATGYRVRVGKFKTQNEALELEEKLSKEGFPTKLCP